MKFIFSLMLLCGIMGCTAEAGYKAPVQNPSLEIPVSENKAALIFPTLINGTVIDGAGWEHVVSIRTGNAGCTATVVGPRVIITAAHCANTGSTSVFSYRGKQYSAKMTRSSLYPGKDHDVCVGVTSEAMPGDYGIIGGVVAKGKKLTLLGYGCTNPGGTGGNDGKLRIGDATVINFSNYDAVSSDGAALCFGDSGGPGFLENEPTALDITASRYLLATINSKGNIKDTNYTTRLDITESQSFLKDFATKNAVDICGINAPCSVVPPGPGNTIALKNAVGELSFKVNDAWLKDPNNNVDFVKNVLTSAMKYIAGE